MEGKISQGQTESGVSMMKYHQSSVEMRKNMTEIDDMVKFGSDIMQSAVLDGQESQESTTQSYETSWKSWNEFGRRTY